MNSIWDSNLLKKVINAKSNKSWEAKGLQIDSRKVKKGDLFFALKGDKHDGHDYIGEAVKNGASVCLIANKKNRGGLGYKLTAGIAICFLYIFLMKFAVTFTINSNIPALITVWSTNIFYLISCVFLFKKLT